MKAQGNVYELLKQKLKRSILKKENELCGLLSHKIAESAIFFLPIIYMGGYLI